ncbi:MAG TPA: DUF1697 domain-containing protein [Pyrinomonadaceae bacterium]|nr:DUF1697 domain-containing protein [Pyrinomonadaceae bacterium]
MPKYFAFLRAINVGGHTVKMDYLRSLFEGLGFSNVETFIASGNVIFDSSSKSSRSLEKKIETTLEKALGYEVLTFVRSVNELTEIAAYQPFARSDINAAGHSLYVGFMPDRPGEAAKQGLLSLATKDHDFHVNGREVYWLCRTNFSDSTISGALLAKTLGMPATLRNSTTIKKLAAKYC